MCYFSDTRINFKIKISKIAYKFKPVTFDHKKKKKLPILSKLALNHNLKKNRKNSLNSTQFSTSKSNEACRMP